MMDFKINICLLLIAYCMFMIHAADIVCNQHPVGVHPKSCCQLPELFSDEVKAKCKQYDVRPPYMPPASGESSKEADGRLNRRHPHPSPCYNSCFFNETGIFKNEIYDNAKLQAYLQTVLQDDDVLHTVLQDAFATCAEEIKQFKGLSKNRPSRPPPPAGMERHPICPHAASKIMGCVMRTSFKNCPPSIWNDSPQCNKLRMHMINCMHPHGPRPRPTDKSTMNEA